MATAWALIASDEDPWDTYQGIPLVQAVNDVLAKVKALEAVYPLPPDIQAHAQAPGSSVVVAVDTTHGSITFDSQPVASILQSTYTQASVESLTFSSPLLGLMQAAQPGHTCEAHNYFGSTCQAPAWGRESDMYLCAWHTVLYAYDDLTPEQRGRFLAMQAVAP